VTGLYGTVDRLAQVGGPLLAGAVVAGFGPLTALLIDGASFAISGAVVAATIGRDRRSATAESGRYRQRLRAGLNFLRGDRLLRAIVGMVAVTNLIDTAVSVVLLPVGAGQRRPGGAGAGRRRVRGDRRTRLDRRHRHRAPAAPPGHLPRRVLRRRRAPDRHPRAGRSTVDGCRGVDGLGSRCRSHQPDPVRHHLRAGSGAAARSGDRARRHAGVRRDAGRRGPVAGLLVATAGFAPAVLVLAAAYFAATTLPALRPQWRELDARRARRPPPVTAPGPARPGTRRTRLPAA
jgi:hypothetical protein